MPPKNKAGYGLSGLAMLVLLFLAMPWLTVSCSGHELLHQNGYQVIVGSASAEEGEKTDSSKKEIEKEKQKGESLAAWWLLLVPLGAIVAGLAGFLFARGNTSTWRLGIGGSGIAALCMTLALVIGLPMERKIDDMKAEMQAEAKKQDEKNPFASLSKAMSDMIGIRRHNGIWLTVAATWGMVGTAIYLQRIAPKA